MCVPVSSMIAKILACLLLPRIFRVYRGMLRLLADNPS